MKGRYYPRVNTSRNQLKLKKILEEGGYTQVEVWWEPLESAMEMCGMGGGFFFDSEEESLQPLGYSYKEAEEYILDYYVKNKEEEK